MKNYNVAFSINRNYLLFCFITIHSLLHHNKNSFFNIYIQHNNCLSQNDIDIFLNQPPLSSYNNFQVYLLDCSSLEELADIKDGGKWTKEIYFKLFLPNLLPNVDKVLFLDADVLITSNIEAFLDKNLGNYIFCGDKFSNRLNVGILLINMIAARNNNIKERSINFIKEQFNNNYTDFYKITEEYAINTILADKITYADNIITLTSKSSLTKNYSAIHFVGIKPWHLDRRIAAKDIKKIYLNYLNNLRLFAKNKTSEILIVSLYYYLLYGGYFINSFARRIKNSIYKNIFKMPKYKYLHTGLTMSFIIKNSILNNK
ncbi:MAG: hypothetical protein FWE18_02100 [Alphaproteobacteria bacterium]|nr:hypothetical protein [Alphaproteobacteria bacterium]